MAAHTPKDPALADHLAWLGYVQPDGLVVSAPALVDAQAIIDRAQLGDLQRRFADHISRLRLTESDTGETQAGVENIQRFVTEFLGWPYELLVGVDPSCPLPDSLSISLPEFQETLRPSFAIKNPNAKDGASPWLLLVQSHPATADLDKPVAASDRNWHASPAKKFERLLRETGVSIGLLTNGVQFRLTYAPPKENSGSLTFPVGAMAEVPGRLILGAFQLLHGSWSLFNAPTEARLPGLLQRSRDYQASVSEILAEQVLHALYELLRGFEAADERVQGKLLRELAAKDPHEIYGGLVTVLLRLVFTLFAEDRGLLPSSGLYVRHYAVHGLFERLRADAERYPDTMDHRFGAWAQLLALFRVIHAGCKHSELKMPGRSGHLFDPDRYPFLEGRASRRESLGALPLVSDGVIYRILEKLCVLEGECVSYRTLDVEEIGSVYQTIMGFAVEPAAGISIALKGKRKRGGVPAALVINLDQLLAILAKDRAKWLKENADTELTGEADKKLKAAATVDDLLLALEKRIDLNATPGPVARGGLVLQPTDERRRSGTEYTPRTFTRPIVQRTLEPILKRLGEQPRPEQILELKICDLAIGSGAFQVETCRQLGDELVKAWRVHGGRPALPPDETEELLAMRTVAQHCLYGVDRNPMAVDLAKLSLWLATLAKDHPFTFLDHAIRCGDSLVGLTRKQIEDFTWRDTKTTERHFFSEEVRKRTSGALRERQNLLALGDDYTSPQLKREKLEKADELLDLVRFIGDAAVAAFFAADKDKARETKRVELAECISDYLNKGDIKLRPTAEVNVLRSGRFPMTPFHWEIEFPEVFERHNPGFDAFVGNPPFLGGKHISASNGREYVDWLLTAHDQTNGNADVVAHFFRRAFSLLRLQGCMGLIATNTIGQGDTRSAGLCWICNHNGTIYAAQRRFMWPGQAAVVVSVVWIAKDTLTGPFELDGRSVPVITAYLFHAGGHESPACLASNSGKCFIGSYVLGMGFTFDDSDSNGAANSLADMQAVTARDPRNSQRIFPYIGGEEVNDSPTHTPQRFVIDFGEMTEEEARQWPDLMEIVERKVRPERKGKPGSYSKQWWLFGRRNIEGRRALSLLRRAVVRSRIGNAFAFTFLPSNVVMNEKTVVFAFDNHAAFGVVQSRLHEIWAVCFSSTLKDDLQYTPTDCFSTFPFPAGWETNAALEAAGREYFEFRATLMVRNNEGLTKTYNRFHDPEERSPDILKLRELHAAMDASVLTAYAWTDLIPKCTCEFLLDYEDGEDESAAGLATAEGKARKRKKPWRYRWPDEVRDEVLARLLKLNAERAEQEKIVGQTASAQKPKPKKAAAKAPKAGKAQLGLGIAAPASAEPKLPGGFRLPASQPLLYTTNLVVAILSESGGSLAWPRLLDAFVLATHPKLTERFAPAELGSQANSWAARWNETVPDGLLLPSLNQLGSKNLTLTEGNEGPVFHLLDGPRPPATEDLDYDAWLALRVGATLAPDALHIPERAKWTKEAKKLVLA
ncbi:MAG TPA: DNA methyltransferase [Terriglobia bacterium]|nr:DNA methyltransferase [Terriglobia bacterium]